MEVSGWWGEETLGLAALLAEKEFGPSDYLIKCRREFITGGGQLYWGSIASCKSAAALFLSHRRRITVFSRQPLCSAGTFVFVLSLDRRRSRKARFLSRSKLSRRTLP